MSKEFTIYKDNKPKTIEIISVEKNISRLCKSTR